MDSSKVSKLLAQELAYFGDRNKIIASNIANIDTPGYKTKDLVRFDDVMQDKLDSNQPPLQMSMTHNAHFQIPIKPTPHHLKIEVPSLKEDLTGNNVDVDKQMAEYSKNNIIFNATKAALKKDNQMMKSVLESSVKLG
jgi:flagellar basal-body rod protein FlgB